jgi:hypothetical protein
VVSLRDAIIAAAAELGYPFGIDDFPQPVGRPWPVNRATLQPHIGPSPYRGNSRALLSGGERSARVRIKLGLCKF